MSRVRSRSNPSGRPKHLKVRPHPYAGDGAPDTRGADRCLWCGLPRARADVHGMPVVSDEVAATEARKLGEAS